VVYYRRRRWRNRSHYRAKYALMPTNEPALGAHCHFGSNARGSMSISQIAASQPPTGPNWAHELKHDGYRLQTHIRDGRVLLFTMNGADQLEWHSHPIIEDSDGQCAD
jgi:ATP-dependent DNA ligase